MICQWQADQLFPEAEGMQRQIIDLRDNDKSRYFAINEFTNCFIIRSPSLYFNDGERSDLPSAHGQEYYLQPNTKAKHNWTTFRMSRPLFVGRF